MISISMDVFKTFEVFSPLHFAFFGFFFSGVIQVAPNHCFVFSHQVLTGFNFDATPFTMTVVQSV